MKIVLFFRSDCENEDIDSRPKHSNSDGHDVRWDGTSPDLKRKAK